MLPYIIANSNPAGHGLLPGLTTGDLGAWANGVKLDLQRCKIICVARPGQQVVAGDRLADRIGIGGLAKGFTPELGGRGRGVGAGGGLADRMGMGVLAKVSPRELVDRVVEQGGVREQPTRTLPARVV